jgi:hypothetical protein
MKNGKRGLREKAAVLVFSLNIHESDKTRELAAAPLSARRKRPPQAHVKIYTAPPKKVIPIEERHDCRSEEGRDICILTGA